MYLIGNLVSRFFSKTRLNIYPKSVNLCFIGNDTYGMSFTM
ncbi:hypothetical protein L580_2892 [Serratia fonticola AU-P3(3)]|nr:hypothetical protein L580_2892 [Serratia fonticola AU-P3(3)]